MTGPEPVVAPPWHALAATIAGEVALPGSPSYEQGHRAFNARFHDQLPRAVVRCATPQDVSETIGFLARHHLDHVTRSGGHCFGGRSSTRGVVIDVTPIDAVAVSGEVAIVGGGARLGEVYEALGQHDVTIPGGTCPAVGVAGLALGGGLGILGRAYGVTSDRLIGAEIVLADGRIVDCDETRHGDLFWALRGAGAGNFGVVTSLRFATIPARDSTNFHVSWLYPAAAAVIDAWQNWSPVGPDELAASLKVTAAGDLDQPASVDLYGSMAATESDAIGLLDDLITRAGSDPTSAVSQVMSPAETRRFWANLGDAQHQAGPGSPQQPRLFHKSEFFRHPLPRDAIDALLDAFTMVRAKGESRELDFMPWSGAYNRIGAQETAFVHRHERFLLKHATATDPAASPAETRLGRHWLDESWAISHEHGSGRVFQNFADRDLTDWAHAYYGSNLPRLTRVKARYDPDNQFRFHQSVPVG